LQQAYGKEINNARISEVEEISGHGVTAAIDGRKVAAGNAKLMKKMNISYFEGEIIGTAVHVAIDGKYAGYILISDEIKPDSLQAIKTLKKNHIRKTVMLTGDNKAVAEKIANSLEIDKVYSELLPVDKVDRLEELFSEKSENGKLVFVGDGMNDAPVLARADIGIAMGGLGSDAAIEAADVVLMTDEPSKLVTAIKISKKTLRIAQENMIFAIGVKILVLLLSALGIATMWAAVFADVGVTIIAIINSFRALRVNNM
jgi:Cd2+/Zn2+-exporting ATPase